MPESKALLSSSSCVRVRVSGLFLIRFYQRKRNPECVIIRFLEIASIDRYAAHNRRALDQVEPGYTSPNLDILSFRCEREDEQVIKNLLPVLIAAAIMADACH